MPSTGFIKPTSIDFTSGTVENENALLDTGDAKLTGNGATIVARYPDFNIPQNSTITAITVKLRATPVAISTVAVFRATPIITSATSVTSLQAIQQIFNSNDNSLVLDEALDLENTYNSFLPNPITNPIIQGLVPTPTNQGPAPESVFDINFAMSDPTDPVADVLTINCGALSPVVNIEYSIPTFTKTIITNSTKVFLKGLDPSIPRDSGERGAVTLVNSDGVQSPNSLLNGVGSNASFSPDGFAILSDFFTSSNPEGEFTIPEDASNIQVTVKMFGFNADTEGNVRFKYSFASTGNGAITIVGNPGTSITSGGFNREHNDVLTDSGFTPSFWNNFTQVLIQLNDDYPFSNNYNVAGFSDQNDLSLRLTYQGNSKVIIRQGF
jgi:hypothetical protein